jgi:hypothetical protein
LGNPLDYTPLRRRLIGVRVKARGRSGLAED